MGSRIKKMFLNLDDMISSTIVALIIIITVVGVFMRFVLGDPLKWTEEASLALFVWLTFIGSSSVMKHDGHVSIDFLFEKSSESVRKVLIWIKYVIMWAVLIVVFIGLGSVLASHAWDKVTPILRIPYAFIDFSIPLGGLLASIHLIRLMLKGKKTEDDNDNLKAGV
jgi:TRAP-type C4-dicarboxylate transport system permease small subunit